MTKILILEQSKSMRNSLRERLDFENYSTEAVDSTEAAAELCNRIAFDVLIAGSGMTLPDRNGLYHLNSILQPATATAASSARRILSSAAPRP